MSKIIKIIIIFFTLVSISYAMNNPYEVDVDFSRSNVEKRLFIYHDGSLIYKTYVAHGSKSGKTYARRFSNKIDSHMSSLGHYRLAGHYVGKHGESIILEGLDSTNSNAREREIVIHSASYARGGYSWGCFAVMPKAMKYLLALPRGTILYAHI